MADTTLTLPADNRMKLPVFGVIGTSLKTFAKAPLVFMITTLIVQSPGIVMLLANLNPDPRKLNRVSIAVSIGTMLIVFFAQAAMTHMTLRLLEGERLDVGEAFKIAARRYFPVLGTTLLAMLATYLSLFLLLVPGLIVACIYAVAMPVCVIETKGPFSSLKRSGILTKRMRWRVAGIFFFLVGLTSLVTLPTTFLLTLRGHVTLGQWISVAVQFIYIPLAAILPTVTYVELRRLKEKVGIAGIFD